ncbi:MAG: hypothetical protein MZV65_00840 [Chromatiales bacterium]|nr:hypothetical protein [Chromatiales bacterium]
MKKRLPNRRAGSRIPPFPNWRNYLWIQVVERNPHGLIPPLLLALDKGEKHTLDMAIQYHADWVIIDEKIGRNFCRISWIESRWYLGDIAEGKTGGLDCVFLARV